MTEEPSPILSFPEWQAKQTPADDPLDPFRKYSDYAKTELLRSGIYSDEVSRAVDTEIATMAQETGLEFDTKDFYNRPEEDLATLQMHAIKQGDMTASEAVVRYKAALESGKLYKNKDAYRQEVESARQAAEAYLTPESRDAARRSALRDGELPFAVFGEGEEARVEFSHAARGIESDEDLAAVFDANPHLNRTMIGEVRQKLAKVPGTGTPAFVFDRQDDFFRLTDTLKQKGALGSVERKLENAIKDYSNGRQKDALDQMEEAASYIPELADFSKQERADFLKDIVRMGSASEVDPDQPENSVRKLSTGQMYIPQSVMMNREWFDKAVKSDRVPPEQKQGIIASRDRMMEQQSPEMFRLIAANDMGFIKFRDERRDKGLSNAAILDEWMSNPDNHSTLQAYAEGVGMSVVEGGAYLALGAPALMGHEGSLGALQALEQDKQDRKQYALMFGKKLGAGFDIATLIAPVAADISISVATGGAASALVGGKYAAKTAIKSMLRSSLSAETKSLLTPMLRASAKSQLVRSGAKKEAADTMVAGAGVEEVLSLAGKDIASKITTSVRHATVSATAFNRSAAATYTGLVTTLERQRNPDGSLKYTREEAKAVALPHAITAGLVTASLTAGFQLLGAAGAERILAGPVSRRQIAAVESLMARDLAKAGAGKLGQAEATAATGMLNDLVRKSVEPWFRTMGKAALEEGAEEALDQFINTFVEANATGEKVDINAALTEAAYAAFLGGVMGAGFSGIGLLQKPADSDAGNDLARKSLLLETARKLDAANAPATAEVYRRAARQQEDPDAKKDVPEAAATGGNVPAPGTEGVAYGPNLPNPVGLSPEAKAQLMADITDLEAQIATLKSEGEKIQNKEGGEGRRNIRAIRDAEKKLNKKKLALSNADKVIEMSGEAAAEVPADPEIAEIEKEFEESGEPETLGAAGEPQGPTRLARRLAAIYGVDLDSVTPSGKDGTITPNDIRKAAEGVPANTGDSGGTMQLPGFSQSPEPTLAQAVGRKITYEGYTGVLIDDGGRPALQTEDGTIVEIPTTFLTGNLVSEFGVTVTGNVEQDREAVVTRMFGETEGEALINVFGGISGDTDNVLDIAELGASKHPRKGRKTIKVQETPEFARKAAGVTDEQILQAEEEIQQALEIATNQPNLSNETRQAVIAKFESDLNLLAEFIAARDSWPKRGVPAATGTPAEAGPGAEAEADPEVAPEPKPGRSLMDMRNETIQRIIELEAQNKPTARLEALLNRIEDKMLQDPEQAALLAEAILDEQESEVSPDGLKATTTPGERAALIIAGKQPKGKKAKGKKAKGKKAKKTKEQEVAEVLEDDPKGKEKDLMVMNNLRAAGSAAAERMMSEDPDTRMAVVRYVEGLGIMVADNTSNGELVVMAGMLNPGTQSPESGPAAMQPGAEQTQSTRVTRELEQHGFVSNGDIRPFLESIAKNGKPAYRKVARLLLEFPNSPVTLITNPYAQWAGAMIPSTGQVLVNASMPGPRGAVDTVLHELLHAATVYSVHSPTAQQKAVIARLERIRKSVMRAAAKAKILDQNTEYALGSLDEFITHWFTDPEFQQLVGNLTPRNETSWVQVIIKAIKDLLQGRSRSKAEIVKQEVMEDMIAFTRDAAATRYFPSRRSQLTAMQQPVTAQDAEYMAAVEAGDMETVQRMVDEAAKAAGYDVGPLYHGSKAEIEVFRPSKGGEYGGGIYFSGNPETAEMFGTFASGDGPVRVIRAFLKLSNPLKTSDRNEPRGKGVKALKRKGHDGVIGSDAQGIEQFVVFDPDQIKSADPITRDDQGNVIPLSQRFDSTTPDIRFQPAGEVDIIRHTELEAKHNAGTITPDETAEAERIVERAAKAAGAFVGEDGKPLKFARGGNEDILTRYHTESFWTLATPEGLAGAKEYAETSGDFLGRNIDGNYRKAANAQILARYQRTPEKVKAALATSIARDYVGYSAQGDFRSLDEAVSQSIELFERIGGTKADEAAKMLREKDWSGIIRKFGPSVHFAFEVYPLGLGSNQDVRKEFISDSSWYAYQAARDAKAYFSPLKSVRTSFLFFKNTRKTKGTGTITSKFLRESWNQGYDSVWSDDAIGGSLVRSGANSTKLPEIVVRNPNDVKLADPFTGTPLDKRFDSTTPDIRFQPAAGEDMRSSGVNVRSDTKAKLNYADLIVDGEKTYETRNTNSLKNLVGKVVSIVRTGSGPAKAIGSVRIGEPIVANLEKFRETRNEHLVPEGSDFDIGTGEDAVKYLYPLTEATRYPSELDVKLIDNRVVRKVYGTENLPPLMQPAQGNNYVSDEVYQEYMAPYEGMPSTEVASNNRVYSPIVRDLLQRRAAAESKVEELTKKREDGEQVSEEILQESIDDVANFRGVIARAINEHFPSYKVPVPKSMSELPSQELVLEKVNSKQRSMHARTLELVGEPKEGDRIEVRQDVPAMNRYGVGVVTTTFGKQIPDPTDGEGKLNPTIYRPATRFKNPVFATPAGDQKTAEDIATGKKNKVPTIKVEGTWVADQSMPQDLENWTQVGFNPDRHSYYYERGTDRLVVSGSEAYQIGNTVFVKDVVYGDNMAPGVRFQPAAETQQSAPADLRGIAASSLPEDVDLDSLGLDFDQMESDLEGVSEINREDYVRAAVNRELAHKAGMEALGEGATEEEVARLRDIYTKVISGNVGDSDIVFYRGNPNAMQRLVRYLTAAVKSAFERLKLRFDTRTAVMVDRMAVLLNSARREFAPMATVKPFDMDTDVLMQPGNPNSTTPDIRFQPAVADPVPANPVEYMNAHVGDKMTLPGADKPLEDGKASSWVISMFGRSSDMHMPFAQAKKNRDMTETATGSRVKSDQQEGERINKTLTEEQRDLLNMAIGSTAPLLSKEEADRIGREAKARFDAIGVTRDQAIEDAQKEFEAKAKENRKAYLAVARTAPAKALADLEKANRRAQAELDDKTDKATGDHIKAGERIMEWERQSVMQAKLDEAEKLRFRAGEALEKLEVSNPAAAAWAKRMREGINALQEMGKETRPNGGDIHAVIDISKGVYLVRSYRIHQEPGLAQKILTDPQYEAQVRALTNFFEEQLVEREVNALRKKFGEGADITEEMIMDARIKRLKNRLSRMKAYADLGEGAGAVMRDAELERVAREQIGNQAQMLMQDFLLGHGDMQDVGGFPDDIRIDFTRFLEKKDIPAVIREALQENTDPFYNATRTFGNLANIIANYRMQESFRSTGVAAGWLISEAEYQRNKSAYTNWKPMVTVNPDNPSYGPLAGYYASPQDVEAYAAVFKDRSTRPKGTAAKAMAWLNSLMLAIAGKALQVATQGNPASYVRNPTGMMIVCASLGINPFTAGDTIALAKLATLGGKATPEQEAKVMELISLGVLNNGVMSGYMQELKIRQGENPTGIGALVAGMFKSIGAGGAYSKLISGLEKIEETTGNAWEFSETMFNPLIFYKFKQMLTEAKFGTEEQINQEAARRLRMVVPSRTEAPQALTKFTGSGISAMVAPFARFKADMWRIVINAYKLAHQDMKSDNPVLKSNGRKMMASLIGVHVGFTAVAPLVLRAMMGIGDEEDRAIRAGMPVYARSSNFLYFLDRKNGILTSMDLTYANMFSFNMDPLVGMWRAVSSGNLQDIPDVISRTVGEELFGENIVFGKILDVKRNKDETTGREIYMATDTDVTRNRKIISHIAGAYIPQLFKVTGRAIDAANRNPDEKDEFSPSPGKVMMDLVIPFKKREHRIADLEYRVMSDMRKANSELWKYTAQNLSPAPMSPDDAADNYRERVRAATQVWSEARKLATGFEKLGRSQRDVVNSMTRAGFSRDRAAKALRYGVTDRPVTDRDTLTRIAEIDPKRARAVMEAQREVPRFIKLTE